MRLSSLSWPLAACLVLASPDSAIPAVKIGMNAAFDAGPYLLELVETAAGENSSSYFPLLDRIASGYFKPGSTDAELYNQFLDVLHADGHITSPEALSTFNLALSLRAASPRIEAHYQYYTTAVEPFAERNGCHVWVLLEGKQYCSPDLDKPVREELSSSGIKSLPFDRVIGQGREAVLYADPASDEFAPFHRALSKAARAHDLSYRLRYRRNSASVKRILPMSGFGVELALKRTDYIVIDDRQSSQDDTQRPLRSESVLNGEEQLADLKPLSTSELASIGMKAASFIQQSENPMRTLIKLTQDFPKFASAIASYNISDRFVDEYTHNQAQMGRNGLNVLWMNGAQLIDRQIEPFALVEILRRERKLINGIRHLGFDGEQAVALLGHQEVASAKDYNEVLRYDWTDRLENGQSIIWLNDLETDARYESYPKSLDSVLQRTYPGQVPPIGRNIFNLIIPADLCESNDLNFIAEIQSIMKRGIPIRFGLVPLQTTNEAKIHAKIAYFLAQNYGSETLMSFLGQLQNGQVTTADESMLSQVTNGHELLDGGQHLPLSTILEDDFFTSQLQGAKKWIVRLKADSIIRPLFINGVAIPRDGGWMQAISMTIGEDLQTVQKGVFHGALNDDTWIPGIFLEGASTRRNIYTSLNDEKTLRILDIAQVYSENENFLDLLPVVEALPESPRSAWAVITVLADLSSTVGIDLIQSALDFKRKHPAVRLDFVNTQEDFALSSQVIAALKATQKSLIDIESGDDLKSIIETAAQYNTNDEYAEGLGKFLAETKSQAGSHSVVINGRVIGPITSEAAFTLDDFEALLAYEQARRIHPVYAAVEELGLSDKISEPVLAAKLTSIIALSTISDLPEGIFESAPTIRSTIYNTWDTKNTAIQIGNPKDASIHIVGLLDPASEKAQRWAPILNMLADLDGVFIKLILNPREKIEELPVKRFFRYILDSKPKFDENGNIEAQTTLFASLPSDVLLTAGMDVPPAWLVAPKSSLHDLDNIKLSGVNSDVEATYQLEHILIEGHSREGKGSAPRGAQLVLATATQPLIIDTIIMANLGFFQFKANPGVYNVQLKSGRSSEVYDIESIGAQGWEPVPGDEGSEVALMDFQGATVYPRLKRRPGMEKDDVLKDTSKVSEDNFVAKGLKFAEGLLGSGKSKSVSASEQAEINIFSVASGHLYERMLNIMMVSVMRNTKHTVKFWFIEQFLSPSFKEFIPHLAKAYGFQYEMVTYKWPHWLRQQKEKQREIWGYKILFLDVLFPLSLDKVIFVDADQIVRTDMIDLVNLDLEGAPYGFTPMCDSRTEMEGFRFWKQGYWANYLRGKPYHISALYVVDLKRFRELAAGDRLRQQYHALSADPASLSNLDQDLPNHMQFQIPIHSLPQEWLWCETWCSDESQAKARTIDLCNNPQTKEPKLERARRQVPEWTVYDDEIAALDLKWKESKSSAHLDGNTDIHTDPDASERNGGDVHTHQKDEL